MMNKKRIGFYMLLAVVIFCGCEKGNVDSQSTPWTLNYGSSVEIFVIDSCEYIKIEMGNTTWGGHKGNCKFCAERSTK